MQFVYKAVGAGGKLSEGRLEAANTRGVVQKLESMGLTPLSVEEARAVAAPTPRFSLTWQRVSKKDVLHFTEELSTLIHAGLPLDRSLEIAGNLAEKAPLREAVRSILKQIKSGKSLPDAFAAHPRYFSPLYVNMLRAGEAGGMLDAIMARLVEFERSADELRSYLAALLVYPGLLTAVGLGSVSILLYFVIPRFAVIFEDIGAAVPPETQALLWFSQATRSYWWVVLGGVALAIAAFRTWRATTP